MGKADSIKQGLRANFFRGRSGSPSSSCPVSGCSRRVSGLKSSRYNRFTWRWRQGNWRASGVRTGGMVMRVLITGAAGFIGSRFTRRLLERGGKVRGLLMPGEADRGLETAVMEVLRGGSRGFRQHTGRGGGLRVAGKPSIPPTAPSTGGPKSSSFPSASTALAISSPNVRVRSNASSTSVLSPHMVSACI